MDRLDLIDKDKAGLRTLVDVMDQVHAMLSSETEGLFDLQKQVRSQVVEMCQKSVPLSLPDNVGAKLNTICQNVLNETSRKMKEIQAKYLRDIQKHNETWPTSAPTKTYGSQRRFSGGSPGLPMCYRCWG